MDGKVFKLRASCNACNESKVRCSQTKPTCARCERNKMTCVYGLSRRTHKDAPPIFMSHSHSHSHSHSGSRRSSVHIPSATAITNANYTGTTTPFMLLPNENPMLTSETSYPSQSSVDHFFGQQHQQQQQTCTAPCTGPGTGILSPTNLDLPSFMTPLPTPNEDHTNSLFSSFGNFAAGVGSANGSGSGCSILTPLSSTPGTGTNASTSTDMFRQPQSQGCTCHAGVMEQLASMSHETRNEERRMPLDVQLSQLKRCIVASETSMGCCHHGHGNSEPISIITVAVLVGRAFDEFELMVIERIGRGSTMGTARGRCLSLEEAAISIREPRLSWGVLELEDDDEVELRQRLYLLYFRKLERLLSQLNVFVRTLHGARSGSCNTTFVMACEYIHLWLEKKAEGVKRLFPAADECTGRMPA